MILSGFYATVGVYEKAGTEQKKRVEEVLQQFGLRSLANKPACFMSTGELRKCLIGRAIAHYPEILIRTNRPPVWILEAPSISAPGLED